MGSDFEDGWSSDNKDKPKKQKKGETKPPQKHQLHFAKEKRRGKVVTIVKPFFVESKELKAVLKTLKKKLGTGGTIKEDQLEFQGEVQESLRTWLGKMGYGFKR